ncbi:NmrA/HSCARG family protein [Streptomyces mirabilis]|uniref:NmrA/HSCARG family protein n=1 Tax=Streptomyces mirabilis TaxID=68239 RepID=UPI00364D37DE
MHSCRLGLRNQLMADASGGLAVRAVTRNAASDKARELAAQGVEVVVADIGDEGALAKAFEGAYGAFLLSNFWEHGSPEKEKQQAAAMARAAKAAGPRHVIWSTLDDTREHIPIDDERMPTLMGTYKVPHFDAKAEANLLFTDAGVPTTFLQTTFFWENLIGPMAPQRDKDGNLTLALAMADSKLAGIAVEDIGKTAHGIFKRGTELVGRTVSIAGEHLTGTEMAAVLTKVLDVPVTYVPVPFDVLCAQEWPGAEESANMFQFYAEVPEYVDIRDLDFVRSLHPGPQTFEEWAREHKDAFPRA